MIDHMHFYSEVINQEMWPSLYRSFYQNKQKVKEALSEHSEIVQAMKTKDTSLSREAVQKHFDRVRERVIKYNPHSMRFM